MLGAIGEAAISADIGTAVGAGGTVIDEEIAEAVACGDSLLAVRMMAALLAEAAMLAAIAAAPGSALDESIVGSVGVAVSYAPSGFWAVVPPGSDGWMVVAADQENWITALAGGDFWIRQ